MPTHEEKLRSLARHRAYLQSIAKEREGAESTTAEREALAQQIYESNKDDAGFIAAAEAHFEQHPEGLLPEVTREGILRAVADATGESEEMTDLFAAVADFAMRFAFSTASDDGESQRQKALAGLRIVAMDLETIIRDMQEGAPCMFCGEPYPTDLAQCPNPDCANSANEEAPVHEASVVEAFELVAHDENNPAHLKNRTDFFEEEEWKRYAPTLHWLHVGDRSTSIYTFKDDAAGWFVHDINFLESIPPFAQTLAEARIYLKRYFDQL